jgi:hypothetical protein
MCNHQRIAQAQDSEHKAIPDSSSVAAAAGDLAGALSLILFQF